MTYLDIFMPEPEKIKQSMIGNRYILVQQTINLVQEDPWRMNCLRSARSINAPDWYLAAGFLRNLIWDHLHGKVSPTPLSDVDFVYYDREDTSIESEEKLLAKLSVLLPDVPWEVRNQARMHTRNSDRPYRDTESAISHWVEIPTCVGITLDKNDALRILAPFGLEENWSLKVRPNQFYYHSPDIFRRRAKRKLWLEYWPKLEIIRV